MATLPERVRAAMDAFRNPGLMVPENSIQPIIDQTGRYDFLWSFWDGTWTYSKAMSEQRSRLPDLYKNTRQIWRQADAIVALYEQFAYVGSLSTDGEDLPDGSKGAIPIEPQVRAGESDDGEDAAGEAIKRACAELWAMWNMTSWMPLRPKFTAILGDLMTELVDDPDHGTVMPRIVWPGHVVDLDLDLAGNVKRYTLQYWITIPESRRYGVHVPADRYLFRKEVDGTAFRYFKNDQPDDRYGPGGIVTNHYGFVPAIWDRFEQVFGVRGISSIEKTLQQVLAMNSTLSHALDYHDKIFGAPVGVIGNRAKRRDDRGRLPNPRSDGGIEDAEEEARRLAEELDLMPMTDKGAFVALTPNIGQTVDLLKLVMDSVLAESPEARYGQEILKMTQVTAPGVERALGTIGGRVTRFRGNLDPQTVKLHQMAIAMIGWRLSENAYPQEIILSRPARYDAFRPFDLTSYGRGLLDFVIPDRPWIGDTIDERLARLLIIEQLTTQYALERAGVSEDGIKEILGAKKEEQAREDARLAGMAEEQNSDDDDDQNPAPTREDQGA